uniref:Uncharacterized protein n=1 Tax=Oryza brachyantha TaxID=4533 RepID=J3L2M2_ORYBR
MAESIHAMPLAAVAPPVVGKRCCFLAQPAGRVAPAWIREVMLPSLALPSRVPLHFIGEKMLTASDVAPQQNRISIPIGMRRHLLPLLSPDECAAANLVEVELKLARWSGSNGVIIKGEGFSAFFRDCALKSDDTVEIWVFRRSPCVHLFGVDMQPANGPMHIVIAKTHVGNILLPPALPLPAPVVDEVIVMHER